MVENTSEEVDAIWSTVIAVCVGLAIGIVLFSA